MDLTRGIAVAVAKRTIGLACDFWLRIDVS